MWTKKIPFSCVIIVMYAILPKISDASEGFSQLTLSLSTSVTTAFPLEPIPITISLANDTNTPIDAYPAIVPNGGFLDVFVKRVGDDRFDLFPSSYWPVASVPGKRVTLKPGYRRSVEGILHYTTAADFRGVDPNNLLKQYLLQQPGTYLIKVTLRDLGNSAKIDSNVIIVRVALPQGENALAYNHLKSIRKPYFLMATFGKYWSKKAEETISAQEDFLAQFPNSAYSHTLRYSLGLTYVTKGGDHLDRGIQLLEETSDSAKLILARKALSRLVDIKLKDNKFDDANYFLNLLRGKAPDSGEYRDAAIKMQKSLSDR